MLEESEIIRTKELEGHSQVNSKIEGLFNIISFCNDKAEKTSVSVSKALKSFDSLCGVNSQQVADYLNLHKRSLFRKLQKEGIRYQTLLNIERKRRIVDEKIHLFKTPEELAEILGYSDPKSFYRSFKDWMGTGYSLYKQGGSFY